MRLTKRRTLTLLVLSITALSSLGLASYWQHLSNDDTFSSIPYYPGATSIVIPAPGENLQPADTFRREDSSAFYVAKASDYSIYNFYDKWLLDNGWEQELGGSGIGYAGNGAPGAYRGYYKTRQVVKGVAFTGFDGPFFGAPWLKFEPSKVVYEVGLLTEHLPDLPPGSLRVTLFFSKTSGYEYVLWP